MTQRLKAFAIRFLLAAATWYALTDGATDRDAWIIGVPAIVVSAALATRLIPPFEWSWIGALRFAGFFVWESWRGGVDVARRAFAPSMPLAPGLFTHTLAARSALARVTVADSSSLMPGSLVVDVDPERGRLLIHALDTGQSDPFRTVSAVDARVAEMFSAGRAHPEAPAERAHPESPAGRAHPESNG